MLRKIIATMITGVIALSLVSVAQAHVTLNPDTSEPGSYEKYDVRVPVEKDANTNKIELEVPKGVEVVGVAPDATFDHHFTKDKKGNIEKITWTAKKDGIGPNEFIDLPIQVANPDKEGEFSWKAYQTYDNGDVVKWTGGEDAETPAPVTKVKKGAAQDDNGDDNAKADHAPVSLWILSIVAIILSLVAIFKKSRKS